MERSGEVVITMLPNVQQKTIAPLIKRTIAKGTVVYTDEYDIYDRLTEWGYPHHTVCHSAGEFARDEDGDGFCEVHVNTIEGFWSLLRSWLRPHRGVSQEKLPLYLGLFEFVHNVRKRGKALLGALIELLVTVSLASLPDRPQSRQPTLPRLGCQSPPSPTLDNGNWPQPRGSIDPLILVSHFSKGGGKKTAGSHHINVHTSTNARAGMTIPLHPADRTSSVNLPAHSW